MGGIHFRPLKAPSKTELHSPLPETWGANSVRPIEGRPRELSVRETLLQR